ncbi:hypothetical protein EP7_005038 [Isosphaeraceae bacterium EP7]
MNTRFSDAIRGLSTDLDARAKRDARRGKPACESLEGRVVLSTMGAGMGGWDSQGADRFAQVDLQATSGIAMEGGGPQDGGQEIQRASFHSGPGGQGFRQGGFQQGFETGSSGQFGNGSVAMFGGQGGIGSGVTAVGSVGNFGMGMPTGSPSSLIGSLADLGILGDSFGSGGGGEIGVAPGGPHMMTGVPPADSLTINATAIDATATTDATAAKTKLDTDLTALQTDIQAIAAKSGVTVADLTTLAADEKALAMAGSRPDATALKTAVTELATAVATGADTAQAKTDFNAAYAKSGVSQTVLDQAFADLSKTITNSKITADDLTRIAADRAAIEADLTALKPVKPTETTTTHAATPTTITAAAVAETTTIEAATTTEAGTTTAVAAATEAAPATTLTPADVATTNAAPTDAPRTSTAFGRRFGQRKLASRGFGGGQNSGQATMLTQAITQQTQGGMQSLGRFRGFSRQR